MTTLRLVPALMPSPPTINGLGLAVRAFVDIAMKAFTDAVSAAPVGSPLYRVRGALGDDVFLATAREAIERHVERVLGDGALLESAATISANAVDSAVLDVLGEVIQDLGRAAWSKVSR